MNGNCNSPSLTGGVLSGFSTRKFILFLYEISFYEKPNFECNKKSFLFYMLVHKIPIGALTDPPPLHMIY